MGTDRPFSRSCCDRTRGNNFKPKEEWSRLGIRKMLFMVKVMKQWSRFPREVVDALSLEMFNVRLDGQPD